MPSSETILTGLREIANDWMVVAITWHLLLMTALAGLGWGG